MIQHEAFVNIYNVDNKIFNKLLDNCLKTTTFLNRIDILSENYKQYSYTDKQTSKGLEKGDNKMKGDLFEIFVECYLKILGAHTSIGVANYKPVYSVDDNGVDGTGLGIDGKPLTVQIKFRSDATDELLADDLKQFGFQSIVNYDVDKNTKTNMLLITSAKGMHYHTEHDVFLDKIRTINIKQLEYDTKNNFPFWYSLSEMIENTVKLKYNEDIYNKYTKIKI